MSNLFVLETTLHNRFGLDKLFDDERISEYKLSEADYELVGFLYQLFNDVNTYLKLFSTNKSVMSSVAFVSLCGLLKRLKEQNTNAGKYDILTNQYYRALTLSLSLSLISQRWHAL